MNLLLGWLLATTPAPSDTMVVPLPEVVVTATRTPESAQKAPAAITVVNRSHFADSRGISLKDALTFVPGVFVQSRSGAQDVRVTIRGFGARGNGERSNTGNMRGIRVMTDGIPLTEPDGRTSLDFVDLGNTNQVEVSRSNSSTLYGNASGGVVNLRTNLDFDSPHFELLGRAGSFGYHREQGTVGMAVGGGRGTFSLLNSTFDGWREHSSSSATQFEGRFAIPMDDKTRLGLLLDASSTLNRFPGALTQQQMDEDPQQANPIFVARDERRWNRVGRVGFTVDRSIQESQNLSVNLFAEPKVLQRSERNRFRDFNRYHLGGGATYLLRAALSPGVASVTTLGGDEAFQDGAILFYNLDPGGVRSNVIFANQREAANSAGGFVQQELKFGQHWSVRGAVRYDNVWYLSEDHLDPTQNAEKTFTHWTPKGSVAYLLDNHTIYAALGGGVEAPAFNEIDPPPDFGLDTLTSLNPFLDAMTSTTYEMGMKGQLLRSSALGTVGYDAALYWIDVENELVPFNGGAYFFTAGQSRRKGVELGLDWRPISPLSLRGSFTFSDNEYVDYQNDLGDFSGNEVPGLPRSVIAADAEYRFSMGLAASMRIENVGRYFANDANTASTEAFTLIGTTLAYDFAIAGTGLRAYFAGDNLTDEDYVASVFINGVADQYFEPGLPRNFHGGLTLRWD